MGKKDEMSRSGTHRSDGLFAVLDWLVAAGVMMARRGVDWGIRFYGKGIAER